MQSLRAFGLEEVSGGRPPAPPQRPRPRPARQRVPAAPQVGTQAWLDQHDCLEKLNLQAHFNAQSHADEFVKEALVSLDRVTVLVQDLLVTEVRRAGAAAKYINKQGVQGWPPSHARPAAELPPRSWVVGRAGVEGAAVPTTPAAPGGAGGLYHLLPGALP